MNKVNILSTVVIALVLFACGDTEQELALENENVEQTLLRLINSDEFLGLDGLGDGDAEPEDYGTGLDMPGLGKTLSDTILPGSARIRFGRRILSVTREIVFTDTDADTAYAEVLKTLTGNFIVFSYDTASGDTSRWVKPFTTDFVRRVRFVQADSAVYDSSDGWRVDALTVGVGTTGSKVNISSVELFQRGTPEPVFSFSGDILNNYFSRSEMPVFEAWQAVITEVTVTNNGPEFPFRSGESVALHYGRHRGAKARYMINDSGRGVDESPNDNIFSGVWIINGPGRRMENNEPYQRRVFRSFFDVMDYGSLFAEEEEVHTVFWTLPYHSTRSE